MFSYKATGCFARSRCVSLSAFSPQRLFSSSPLPLVKSALEETQTVKTINQLLSQVRSTGLKDHGVIQMPTRLAPKRSWFEEARVLSSKGSQAEDTTTTSPISSPSIDLTPKKMSDSYAELILPFSKDPALLEKYIATSGALRLGKIFEDLDTLAGTISYQHALSSLPTAGSTSNIHIVTASVDRLDLVEQLQATEDYRLSGFPIFVGNSSMEVFVQIEKLPKEGSGDASTTCLTGRFTMATRNSTTGKSQKIAPLELTTEGEKALFKMGEDHKQRKLQASASSLEKVPPTQEEAALIHKRFLMDANLFSEDGKHQAKEIVQGSGDEIVPTRLTQMNTNIHIHPQQRNVHQKAFGGALMRFAFELAWLCGSYFTQAPVSFLSLDALAFHAPVPIGALLSLSSEITYTSNGEIITADETSRLNTNGDKEVVAAITVLAEVIDMKTGARNRSNTFHFSFSLGETNKRVSPETYLEVLKWLEGRRRVEKGEEMRELYGTN